MNIQYYTTNDSPPSGYWDQALISDILADPIFKSVDDNEGSIVIIPGAYQTDIVGINQFLSQYKWVILFITSDEESKFPVEEIEHPNIKIFVQYPKKGRHDKFEKLPLGYTSDTRKNLTLENKNIDLFYSGQKTHKRREQLSAAIDGILDQTTMQIEYQDQKGFSQGLSQKQYIRFLCQAKIAPAPSGAVSQDSFRFYEALESGAVPIADDISPFGDDGFWSFLFGETPFPVIKDYDSLHGYIDDIRGLGQENANQIQAWWIRKKQDLKWKILDIYEQLSGKSVQLPLSVIIPISYIPSHPDIDILEQTVKSVRYWLPEATIYLTFDGIRKEQLDHKGEYIEFIRRALFMANTQWGNCYPIIFPKHAHQIGMIRETLPLVMSDQLLYLEQDCPLVTDEDIDWSFLQEKINDGTANVIRLHFEGVIPEVHKNLMIGKPENGLLKTIQWSQRPHLASTAFYKRIVAQYFSAKADCFLEDVLHGKLMNDWTADGMQGWLQWRVYIYYPNEKNIKRSLHLDGRHGAEKFDNRQVF